MYKLLSSLLLCLLCLSGYAQQEGIEDPWVGQWVDSTAEASKKRFLPSGIRLSADLFQPIRSALDEDHSGYEYSIDIDINKFYLVYSAGFSKQRYIEEELFYRNRGNYSRVGIAYNLMNTNRGMSAITFGIYRGSSRYQEGLYSAQRDPIFGAAFVDRLNRDMTASWLEASLGLRARITGQFFMGYDFRLAFSRSITGGELSFSSFEIPGYGRSRQGGNLSFQYYVQYRIPFRKKYIPPKKFD